jgi:hypothetical protein
MRTTTVVSQKIHLLSRGRTVSKEKKSNKEGKKKPAMTAKEKKAAKRDKKKSSPIGLE